MSPRLSLCSARRIVVKIGSQLLSDDPEICTRIAAEICSLWADGREVILVTSGAIALGFPALGLSERPRDLPSLQASAAAGQGRLMARWGAAFERYGRGCAQILLTHADLSSRKRYLNARSALLRLLDAGVIPVVNENDTVSVEEIKLGDNDLLAAEVCGLLAADCVVLLTGANGLMTKDPRLDPSAERISVIEVLDDSVRALAGKPSSLGTGGMATKLRAADVAQRHGAMTVIAPGAHDQILHAVFLGQDIGTLVPGPLETPQRARKRWIAHTLKAAGKLFVDEGAERALRAQGSLLFAGVRAVEGDFTPGDCVEICRVSHEEPFARGLVTLGAQDAKRVAGLRTDDVMLTLGDVAPDELIHRDDLALLD